MRNWYTAKNEGALLDVSIHDEIGTFGVSAKELIQDLKSAKAVTKINLSIHSPGGSAFDGIAIYNVLKEHPAKVYARVDGVAASAASIVAMAGDVISMPEDSWMMIHNAWMLAAGDAEELREAADFLDKVSSTLNNIYVKRTGLDAETVAALLAEETWMTAKEAVDYGFADVVEERAQVAALSNDFAKHFGHLPAALCAPTVDKVDMGEINTLKEFEAFLRDAGGLSKRLATAAASRAKELVLRDAAVNSDEQLKARANESLQTLINTIRSKSCGT